MNRLFAAAVMGGLGFLLIAGQAIAQDSEGQSTPLDSMSDFALYSILLGAATPWITAFVTKQQWRSELKFTVMFSFCMIAAGLSSYFTRTLDFDNWVRSLLLVTVAAVGMYKAQTSAIKSVQAKHGLT